MTIEEMNALSEEELEEEELEEAKHNWTLDDWITYYTKDGVMTHQEMYEYTLELALRKIHEKYGRGIQ